MEDKAGWKVEMLMEKLRAKSSNISTLQESSKNLRMALMGAPQDKRQTVDSADKVQLQKCLDQLQGKVKFHSLQGMLYRLESVAKQLGIKFRLSSTGQSCFIECDMFYVELELHAPSGRVREVKIQHEADQTTPPQSCPELVQCLTAGDFAEFTAHLEGLLALYKLNADRKLKMRAYPALRAMEEDLSRLAAIQATTISDPRSLVHRGPVGIVQLRRLGHPMRLTYMVTPYHLLDSEKRQLLPLTVETVTSRGLGLWAEVCLQSSTAHKLQTTSLIRVEERPDGKSVPAYSQLSSSNSCTLPATFVLKLSEKMAMSAYTLDKIAEITSIQPCESPPTQSLLSLIARVSSDGKVEGRPEQPLYVQLPDALHCYYVEGGAELVGAVVEAVPFTHPTHVPPLLTLLRAQALFNTLVASCVRTQTPKVTEGAVCMELTAMSGSRLSVSFEHPQEGGLATLEVDLGSTPRCRLHTAAHSDYDQATAHILQKCLSIPVTMRALMKRLRGAAASRGRDVKPGPAVPSSGFVEPPAGSPAGRRANDAAGDSGSALGFNSYPPFGLNQLQGLWSGTGAVSTAGGTGTTSAPPSTTASAASTPAPAATPSPAPTPPPISAPSPAERPRLERSSSRADSPPPPPLPPPPPPPAGPTEMESIEATVRQIERERSRRPADEPSPRVADKRTELFSFPGGGQPNIPPSLTITPILSSSSSRSSDERKKERRDKERSDKKRRRDESPGGRSTPGRERERGRESGGKPMAMKQGSSPPPKKHSSSAGSSPSKPHGSSSSSGKSSSPVPKKSSSSSSSSSSKHGHLTVSPKHSSSPKHPSVSPKHSSSPKPPSSGKPSLSSLRSPSPSHQSFRSSSSSKSREKSSSKDKVKSHRPREGESSSSRPTPSPGGGGGGDRSGSSESSKSPGRSRKLLNDVISKLNNTLATAEDGAAKEGVGKDGRKTEFTVKPSSEGIKLTINKTKSRSSSSSPSGGNRAPSSKDGERNSPSGLKPGVASGPASKKTFVFPKQSSGSDGKQSSSSALSDLQKSLSAKLMKRPESGSGVRPRSDKHKSDKVAAELAVGGDLPPLPKSLEIRKIERPAPAEPSASSDRGSSGGGGSDLWPQANKTGSPSDAGDLLMDLGGDRRSVPPPPRPPPMPRTFPPSPSVQIHIVKSPAPVASPHQFSLVSPHSSAPSPCVIDDELMDEALVGGK